MFFPDRQATGSQLIPNDSKTFDKNRSQQAFMESYFGIHDVLNKMNRTIERIKKIKEELLKGNTKKAIQEAQQQVQQLTQLTSEEEVQRKLKQKRQEIEEERQSILQSTMEFSNKCIEYKSSLSKVMNCTKDLLAEIQFLDSQISSARMTNEKLKKQLETAQS